MGNLRQSKERACWHKILDVTHNLSKVILILSTALQDFNVKWEVPPQWMTERGCWSSIYMQDKILDQEINNTDQIQQPRLHRKKNGVASFKKKRRDFCLCSTLMSCHIRKEEKGSMTVQRDWYKKIIGWCFYLIVFSQLSNDRVAPMSIHSTTERKNWSKMVNNQPVKSQFNAVIAENRLYFQSYSQLQSMKETASVVWGTKKWV